MVSLSLFQTLLSLNCEDVILQLILRYLHSSSYQMLKFNRLIEYELDKSTDFNHSCSVCYFFLHLCVCVIFVCRYLLPCNHVMLSQRRSIRETDIYGKSADKFLSLIPECCRLNMMHPTEQEEDGAFWGRGE